MDSFIYSLVASTAVGQALCWGWGSDDDSLCLLGDKVSQTGCHSSWADRQSRVGWGRRLPRLTATKGKAARWLVPPGTLSRTKPGDRDAGVRFGDGRASLLSPRKWSVPQGQGLPLEPRVLSVWPRRLSSSQHRIHSPHGCGAHLAERLLNR